MKTNILLSFFLIFAFSAKTFSQTSLPNSFQGFTLGDSESSFLEKSKTHSQTVPTFGTKDILIIGMNCYLISGQAEGGETVNITCCFHRGSLAVIVVDYVSRHNKEKILVALTEKHGPYTYRRIYREKSLDGDYSIDKEDTFWHKKTCNLLFLHAGSQSRLIYSDRAVQNELRENPANLVALR